MEGNNLFLATVIVILLFQIDGGRSSMELDDKQNEMLRNTVNKAAGMELISKDTDFQVRYKKND